ncbi:MAG: hypothetical protein NTV34_20840, partial [Proteobacteria bacterium]|nr:hypothetical protein [Pseudomonadota bacterium]
YIPNTELSGISPIKDTVSENNAYVQDETTKLLQGKCPANFSITNNIGTACTFKPRWTSGTVSTEKSAVDEGRKKDRFSEKLTAAAAYGDITCP